MTDIPESISVNTNLDHFNSNKKLYLDYKNSNPFSALNTSMMNSGICITLDADVILDKPIQVIYATKGYWTNYESSKIHFSTWQ
ncbi:MAG: hypothetical protein CM1200mP1_13430 [Candidatus Neomarinimicrobiota bacterium]|nr:MAG: hypothetical protein CM1200mP1_13430 [Candidatus Neomarinimicrobiota bacterium]